SLLLANRRPPHLRVCRAPRVCAQLLALVRDLGFRIRARISLIWCAPHHVGLGAFASCDRPPAPEPRLTCGKLPKRPKLSARFGICGLVINFTDHCPRKVPLAQRVRAGRDNGIRNLVRTVLQPKVRWRHDPEGQSVEVRWALRCSSMPLAVLR